MLEDTPHRRGPVSGALIAEGGLAALECSAEQRVPAGDHLLLVARVTGLPHHVTDSGAPLIRFRRHYRPLGSTTSPSEEPSCPTFARPRGVHAPSLLLVEQPLPSRQQLDLGVPGH